MQDDKTKRAGDWEGGREGVDVCVCVCVVVVVVCVCGGGSPPRALAL